MTAMYACSGGHHLVYFDLTSVEYVELFLEKRLRYVQPAQAAQCASYVHVNRKHTKDQESEDDSNLA